MKKENMPKLELVVSNNEAEYEDKCDDELPPHYDVADEITEKFTRYVENNNELLEDLRLIDDQLYEGVVGSIGEQLQFSTDRDSIEVCENIIKIALELRDKYKDKPLLYQADKLQRQKPETEERARALSMRRHPSSRRLRKETDNRTPTDEGHADTDAEVIDISGRRKS